jgi:hypothetical protein
MRRVPLLQKRVARPFQTSQSFVITGADRPGELPRNYPSAGTKSPLDSPWRLSSGNTSVIFGVLRHQGGRIAEENRQHSPVCGSVRRSLTRGAIASSTAPALVTPPAAGRAAIQGGRRRERRRP